MSVEKGLVDRNILERNDSLGAHDLDDAIEQQHGVAMRQNLQQVLDAELKIFPVSSSGGMGLIIHGTIAGTTIIHSLIWSLGVS